MNFDYLLVVVPCNAIHSIKQDLQTVIEITAIGFSEPSNGNGNLLGDAFNTAGERLKPRFLLIGFTLCGDHRSTAKGSPVAICRGWDWQG